MKIFAAITLLSMFASAEPKVYPVKIHILHIQSHGRGGSAIGQGMANFNDNGTERGVDFTYKSCEPFREAGAYMGRWAGNGHGELIITRTDLHAKDPSECILNVIVKDFTYVKENGQLMEHPIPKQ